MFLSADEDVELNEVVISDLSDQKSVSKFDLNEWNFVRKWGKLFWTFVK